MPRYIALLRGINVGGKNLIKMEALRAAMTAAGFADVRTLLASGNVAFDAEEQDPPELANRVEGTLQAAFGRALPVLVRSAAQMQDLIDSAPFAGVEVTPQTRLYVSFLSDPPKPGVALPDYGSTTDFEILRLTPTEVCSVLTLARTDSVKAMEALERLFGPRITTRNWNTVLKLGAL